MYFLIYLLLITLFFLFYVEITVGHVFYRINSLGNKSFNISNIFYYLVDPLKNTFLWNFELLDVNYIFILIISIIIYFIVLYYNGENKTPEI